MPASSWQSRIVAGQPIIPAPIFPHTADHALEIFKKLRITDIAGQPTFGEVSEQWVFDFVRAIFGGYDAQTGEQLIQEFMLLVPKKSTKSTVSAGVMLTALVLCWRQDEEHLILAPTREIAANAFVPAASMVRADEELSARFHVRDHLRIIECRVTRNSLKVVAADADTVGGKKAGRVLVDELWLFGKRSNAESMLMEATGGQVSRPEGFTIYLSTQSDEPPAGVFRERLNYFRDVRDGVIDDPKALPILYEYPDDYVEKQLYLDPDNWHITNPNMGRSVSKEWLLREFNKVKNRDDGSFQQFLAKHLNVEIGINLRSDRWAGADYWQEAEVDITLDELIEQSEVITIGIDGGGLDDLLGFYVVGRRSDTGGKLGWGYAWASKSVIDRRKEIAPRLLDMQRDGELTVIKTVGQDVDELVDLCEQIKESGKMDKIGVDPAGIGAILDKLEDRGFTEDDIVGVSQGWKLGSAIKTAERWLATEGAFSPARQGLMQWAVSNAKVEPRANSIMITKQKSGSAKIDPLMAMFNAVTLMAFNPESPVKEYNMFFV